MHHLYVVTRVQSQYYHASIIPFVGLSWQTMYKDGCMGVNMSCRVNPNYEKSQLATTTSISSKNLGETYNGFHKLSSFTIE